MTTSQIEQLKALKNSYDLEYSTLNATYDKASQQVNVLLDINTNVLSVTAALGALSLATSRISESLATSATAKSAANAEVERLAAEAARAAEAKKVADAAIIERGKTTAYTANKASELNAIDYKGRSNWTPADVETLFAQAGLTAQMHSARYAAAEGLPAFGTSGVYSRTMAQKMFTVFIGRQPSENENSEWGAHIVKNGVATAVSDLVDSAYYRSQHTTVASLYENILMRAAAPEEIAGWTDSGWSAPKIAQRILLSPEYLSIRAVRGFASGGYHDGGWMMVGEQGRELVNTGPSHARIFNNKQTENLIDISALVASNTKIEKQIELLRKDFEAQITAVALNTYKTFKVLEQEFQG